MPESDISLEEIYNHPLVSEIINENKQLRLTLSEKPDVKDLKDVPLPYTIKRHILIKAGTHNGVYYSPQILRMAVDQHEGLPVFLDHHQNDQGGTAETWAGETHNPVWSEADDAILGDIDIVDPKSAIALAYGAKFGVSATVDVDTIHDKAGKEAANDPVFKSYSLVLDPAVRETMLNENIKEEKEEIEMSDELDFKSDLKPALAKLDDAIRRASAMKDTSLLETLKEAKAIISKLGGTEYPYPKPSKMGEMEAKLAELEQLITDKLTPSEPSSPPVNEELEAALKENEKMKEQLGIIEHEKLATRAGAILKKELELGLLPAAETDARRKELETMDAKVLDAVEQNLDKTIKILSTPDDTKPEADAKPAADRKELSHAGSEQLLTMMVKTQSEGEMKYGGET